MARTRRALRKTYHTPTSPRQKLLGRNYDVILALILNKEQKNAAESLNTSISSLSHYLGYRNTSFEKMKSMLTTFIHADQYTPEHARKFKNTITKNSMHDVFFAHTCIITAMFLTSTPEEVADLLEIPFLSLLQYLQKHKMRPESPESITHDSPHTPPASPSAVSVDVTPSKTYDNAAIQDHTNEGWHTLPGSELDLSSLTIGPLGLFGASSAKTYLHTPHPNTDDNDLEFSDLIAALAQDNDEPHSTVEPDFAPRVE